MSKKKSKAKKQSAPEIAAPTADADLIGHFKRHWKFWVSTLVAIVGAVGGRTVHLHITGGGDSVSGDGNTVSVDRSTTNGDRIVATGSGDTVAERGSVVATGDGTAVDNSSNVSVGCNITNTTNVTNITSNVFNVTINLDGASFNYSAIEEVLRGTAAVANLPVVPKEKVKVTLRDPTGLQKIADRAKAHYVEAQFKDAVEWATTGEEIIAPIITPYAHKPCSIESRFATNIMNVYLILAEDAWSRGDYTAAKKYANLVLSVWGPRVSGDVYGFAAVIDLDERGGSDSVLCDEAVRRLKNGDKEWLYQYLNRLARWGYAHPVAIDSKTKTPYLVSLEKMFGLPRKLQYCGPYVKVMFPMKDGRELGNGELNVRIYQGMGRFTEGYIPDPDGHDFPSDFTGDIFMPTAKKVNGRPRPVPAELQPKK